MAPIISKIKLLEAGTHFGHETKRWNPKMKPYIHGTKGKTHVIDLVKTIKGLEVAYKVIKFHAAKKGNVLFVCTRRNARDIIKEQAERAGSFYVNQRWLGGTLTNFKTIQSRVRHLLILENKAKNNFEGYTKKEGIKFSKEMLKLQKFLEGIKGMHNLPSLIVVLDPNEEQNAINEARKLGIPIVGLVDTNADPDSVDYIIPANDDALKTLKLIMTLLTDAIVEAKGGTPEIAYQNIASENPYFGNRGGLNKPGFRSPKFVKRNVIKVLQTAAEVAESTPVVEKKAEVKTVKVISKAADVKVTETEKVAKPATPVKEEAKVVAKKVATPVKEETKVVAKKEAKPTTTEDLSSKKLADLKVMAKNNNLKGYSALKKSELIELLKSEGVK